MAGIDSIGLLLGGVAWLVLGAWVMLTEARIQTLQRMRKQDAMQKQESNPDILPFRSRDS